MGIDINENDLLSRYRDGDVDALEALIEAYRRPLFAFIYKMVGNDRHRADDIYQETWIRAIRGFNRYRAGNFYGWIIRIARNLVIDRARRRTPDVSLDARVGEGHSLVDVLPAGGRGPDAQAAGRDTAARVGIAVAELPPEQREVFVMRMHAGLSFREIAAQQGVSINTALARMQYALAKLRPLLRQEYAETVAAGGGGGR